VPLPAAIDPLDLARHLDRVRRRHAALKHGVVTRELPGGWLTAEPGKPPAEFPSASMDRVYWFARAEPVAAAEIDGALGIMRGLGVRRAYLWLAPWACPPETQAALARAGASPWPHVRYVALARPAAPAAPARPTALVTRRIDPAEAPALLARIAHWYPEPSAAAALALIADGRDELHAAFDPADPPDPATPVALAFLALDGPSAYLFAAMTDPARRARGGQSALIAARVTRAAELGLAWCTCETNTAVPVSLANLHRHAFAEAVEWRVYRWDEPAASPAPPVAT
jgi:GNAT superfamily N-acetyltransferase